MVNYLFSDVINYLLSGKYFSDFKYRKRDFRLIKVDKQGFEAIEFQYWDGYDLLRDKRAMVIKPLYIKRFDLLHKWFEKYSFKSKADQKDNFSIGFDGNMLGQQNEFHFLINKDGFQKDVESFKNEIIKNATHTFNKFSTIDSLFKYQIDPILQNQVKLPDVGADWVFEYLTLTKIVQPETYQNVKEILTKQIHFMNSRNEPNIIEYYSRFREITEYLEAQQLPPVGAGVS